MSKAVRAEIEALTRKLLAQRVALLTAEQRATFWKRVYPNGVPESALVSAIDLCDRTIRKNVATGQRIAGFLASSRS